MDSQDPAVKHHQPGELARQRAKAAGLDLEELKRTDPQQYKMLNAQRLLSTTPALVNIASDVFTAAFRHYDLFQFEDGTAVLLCFPPLNKQELARFGDALARLVALPAYQKQYAYYRVVNDTQGERRELDVPIAPQAWRGEKKLVGPFETEAAADSWGELTLKRQPDLAFDSVYQAGAWFCDVFSS